MPESSPPQRKTPIHLPPRFTGPFAPVIYLTVCTHHRKPILARQDAVKILCDAWQEAQAWAAGGYVVMPDHIHLLCAPRDGRTTLECWVRYWKSLVSRRWPWRSELPLWQRSFWDRQLRSHEALEEKWAYMQRNPVRKGLCEKPEEWPFLGILEVLGG